MTTFLRTFGKVNGGLLVGGAGFTAYSYPELRSEPAQLVHAMRRGLRCASTCILMAYDYNFGFGMDNVASETHYRAAGRLFNCFCLNGGPYIKLGQMMG
jgi:predicted unusual protein kinase regulating ubiquinone biosynthesis (AarF/ABC1/UbiB family)